MKKTSKFISLFLCLVLVASVMSVAMISASAATNPYSDAAMAVDAEYAYDGELGALYSPDATTFKVWAPLATEVKLNRYATGSDEEAGASNLGTVEMEKLMDGEKWTGVWTTAVQGDIVNTYYTYTITNPDHIYNSRTFVTHETQDPYSYAVGVNGNRSMVVDLTSSAANPEGWDQDKHVFTDTQSQAIVWEVHVKDFSFNPNSGVSEENRGKFLGFTEKGTTLNNEGVISTGIDYLKKLGVTHVQINPMYDFATIDETDASGNQFNWGYDPKNYGVPEGSYSSNPYDGNVRIKEAKAMIQALHEAGISVIMDVVYNHTYSVDSCFNYTVPEYYYRMKADGSYSQQSGCGNDTASERAMYRKYMREMLAYWTNEYHFDGYRFDLMGVHDGETMNLVREDMDEIDPRIVMYGEGWQGDTAFDPTTCAGTPTFMTTQSNASKIDSRIGFFNDQIRDGLKGNVFHADQGGFINSVMNESTAVSFGVRANTQRGGRWLAQSPEQCVTYASCHDNYTLYDKLVYVDEGSSADYRKRYAEVIEQNKLAGAIINTSQGIDFLLAGEEMGRSKDGDENSYKSAATLNMIDWSLLKTNADLVSYYRGLFELRKSFSPFTSNISDGATGAPYKYYFDTSINGSVYTIAYTVHNETEGEWNKVAVIYNGKNKAVNYTFKARQDTSINANTEWVIVANDKQAGVKKLGEVKGLKFSVPAASAIVAVEKSTYEECALKSDFSTITVNSMFGDEVLASSKIIGTPGEGYQVSPDTSIPVDYELKSVDGEETGTFTDKDQTITYNYEEFKPEYFDHFEAPQGDLNDDGVVDIIDVTVLQRFLANMVDLDEEHEKRGDYDADGTTDVPDVTTLQRYLADMIKPVCTITTRYLRYDENGLIKIVTMANKERYRYGEEYSTSPLKIAYYNLVSTPKNASGTVKMDANVDYFYEYAVNSPVMHVKHSGSATWTPYLWAWAYDQNGTAINCYDGWPGLKLSNPDEDGWYTVKFPIPGGLNYYFIISNNGSPQTKDYGVVDGQNVGIEYDEYPEIWVVIQDDLVGSANGDWCKYYNYNPDLEN